MGMVYLTGGQTKLQLEPWIGNIMKCCVQWNSVYSRKYFPLAGIELVTTMSTSHRLTHRFWEHNGYEKAAQFVFEHNICCGHFLLWAVTAPGIYPSHPRCRRTREINDFCQSVSQSICWSIENLVVVVASVFIRFSWNFQNNVITTIWWSYISCRGSYRILMSEYCKPYVGYSSLYLFSLFSSYEFWDRNNSNC